PTGAWHDRSRRRSGALRAARVNQCSSVGLDQTQLHESILPDPDRPPTDVSTKVNRCLCQTAVTSYSRSVLASESPVNRRIHQNQESGGGVFAMRSAPCLKPQRSTPQG